MLKILFLMTLSLFCCSAAAQADDDNERPPFSVAADLAGIPLGAYGLRIQYSVLPHITFTLPISLMLKEGNLLSQTTTNILRVFGYGIFPALRISGGLGIMFDYQGWYFEPTVAIGYSRIEYPNFDQVMPFVAPTFIVGYQGILDSGFLVNIGIGVSGLFYMPHIVGTNAWVPVSVLAIGYAF